MLALAARLNSPWRRVDPPRDRFSLASTRSVDSSAAYRREMTLLFPTSCATTSGTRVFRSSSARPPREFDNQSMRVVISCVIPERVFSNERYTRKVALLFLSLTCRRCYLPASCRLFRLIVKQLVDPRNMRAHDVFRQRAPDDTSEHKSSSTILQISESVIKEDRRSFAKIL